jgi:hypothetical protein
MELFDVVIFALVICTLYILYTQRNKEAFTVTYLPNGKKEKKHHKKHKKNNKNKIKKYIDKLQKLGKVKLQPYFLEMQFHNDYQDTIHAFNNIVPSQHVMFNKGDLPVTTVRAKQNEVDDLITSFINEVNGNISMQQQELGNDISATGWNVNKGDDNKIKSGWDKQQEALGLPTSIYDKAAERSPIKLLKVDHLEKYETDDEIQHIAYLIVKKQNVPDQMVIRVSFIIEQTDINADREFFDRKKNFYETQVKIEEIFIIGFLTKKDYGGKSKRQDFYNFDGIGENNEFMDERKIMVELNKKRKEYMKEK